jgi:hypothetical protein
MTLHYILVKRRPSSRTDLFFKVGPKGENRTTTSFKNAVRFYSEASAELVRKSLRNPDSWVVVITKY